MDDDTKTDKEDREEEKTETESEEEEEDAEVVSDDLPPTETPYSENSVEELGQVMCMKFAKSLYLVTYVFNMHSGQMGQSVDNLFALNPSVN